MDDCLEAFSKYAMAMRVRSIISVAWVSTLAICGCGDSAPAPPVGLKAPKPAELNELDVKKFKVFAVAAKVWLPKDNPVLTGDLATDLAINRSLPQLKCIVEFETDSVKTKAERFSVGLDISAPYGRHQIVHSVGSSFAKQREDGKFVAELMLDQNRPLALDGKATIGFRVLRYVEGATAPIEVDTNVGTVTILESQE